MTLKEFIDKYTGKFVEYHSFGSGSLNQCVDCANQYIVEVLGLTPIIGTSAQDFPSKDKVNYEYILNTPTGQPTPGDLVIFKSADKVGHISIHVKNISTNLFTSFEQNFPTGSPCKLVNHNYVNVLGWMHPKETMADTIQLDKATFEKLVKNSTAYDSLVAEGISQPQDIQKMRDTTNEYRTQMEKAQQEAKACRDELSLMKQEVAGKLGSTQDLPRILGAIDEIIGTMDQLTRKARDNDESIRQYEVQVTDLKAEVARLQLLLRANNSLNQASMYEMLLELFNRIVKILKVS